jgi:UDP-glucose 4-epimerase
MAEPPIPFPRRALVTGGAGFIGSHIADRLLECGVAVWVLDDLSTGLRANVPAGARFVEGSIGDDAALDRLLADARPEAVFHLAAQMDVRRSLREPVFDATTNVIGSVKLLTACIAHGVRRVVYASSGGAAYGEPDRVPVAETYVPRPISEYGASKLAVEHYLSVYHARGALETVAVRYPNVFGPRQRPDGEAGVVAIFAGRLLQGRRCDIFGDGTKTRDYVFVSDVVHGTLLGLAARSGAVYNLGTGRGVSDREVYDAVAAAVGSTAAPELQPFRPGEVRHIALDATLVRRELGWCPEVPFAEGVRRMVAWLRSR